MYPDVSQTHSHQSHMHEGTHTHVCMYTDMCVNNYVYIISVHTQYIVMYNYILYMHMSLCENVY